MAYTLAIVDEGLLDLTHFKTPNAWSLFNAKEALGVRFWDLYRHVNGAYGGRIEQMFSIGGDEALNNGPKAFVNRFTPMVHFAGPFSLKKGEKRNHNVYVPNYNGRVRVMVVAGDGEAYGNAEKSVIVRRPLMLIGTMPRQIGVGDEMTVSATVFATQKLGKVKVTIETADGLNHGLQFAFTEALFLEIHRLKFDAAFLEETLGLPGVCALFCAENLDAHASPLQNSSLSSISTFPSRLRLRPLWPEGRHVRPCFAQILPGFRPLRHRTHSEIKSVPSNLLISRISAVVKIRADATFPSHSS